MHAKRASKTGKKVAKSVSNDVHIITNWVANSRAWKWIRGVFSGGKGSGVVEGASKGATKLSPQQLGKFGEDAVKAVHNIGDKIKVTINGRVRIPDGLTGTTLSEVKNVKSLSYTKQLRDYADYANKKGLQFDLYIRPNTKLSGPLQDAIVNGTINLKTIPGM